MLPNSSTDDAHTPQLVTDKERTTISVRSRMYLGNRSDGKWTPPELGAACARTSIEPWLGSRGVRLPINPPLVGFDNVLVGRGSGFPCFGPLVNRGPNPTDPPWAIPTRRLPNPAMARTGPSLELAAGSDAGTCSSSEGAGSVGGRGKGALHEH